MRFRFLITLLLSLLILPGAARSNNATHGATFVDEAIIELVDEIISVTIPGGDSYSNKMKSLQSLIDYRQGLVEQGLFVEGQLPVPVELVQLEGSIETIVTDYFSLDDNTLVQRKSYGLLSGNESYALLFPDEPGMSFAPGQKFIVNGTLVGDVLVAMGGPKPAIEPGGLLFGTASLPVYNAPPCTSSGPQNALVVAVNYLDDAGGSPSINTIDNRHFGASNSLADYWDENSYGKISLAGDTYGWHTLAGNVSSSNACIMQTEIRRQALEYAAQFTDVTQYNRLIVVMRDPSPACSWAGRSTTSCSVIELGNNVSTSPLSTYWSLASYQNNTSDAVYLAAHEAGHNLGLGHANIRDWGGAEIGPVYDDSGSTFVEYGDRFDSMGNAWLPTHHNALHKYDLAWIENTDIAVVNGNATVALEPISTQPPFSSGKKAIKLYRGRSVLGLKEHLWLETRRDTGFDSYISSDGTNTIHVHQQRNELVEQTIMLDMQPGTASGVSDYLDAPIQDGDSFTDPFRQITITHQGFDIDGNVLVQVSTPAAYLDNDEDGLPAFLETAAGSSPNNEDSDGDGMLDFAEVCFDGDCSSYSPYPGGGDTDPSDVDTDGDMMDDNWERLNGLDPVDPTDKFLDPDSDGVSNFDEYLAGTDPQGLDFDGDGLSDGTEAALGTNPTNPDTDGDGQSDGWEVDNLLNPLDAADAGLDPDLDGLPNLTEFMLGTNIYLQDSDGDNLPDPDEVNIHNTDPADSDTDDDRLYDGEELDNGTDPLSAGPDSDGDTMPDDWETFRGTNKLQYDALVDLDGDGVENILEYLRATFPSDAQSYPEFETIEPDFSVLAPAETGSPSNPFIDRLNNLVADAQPGDTILLPSGHYLENASFSVTNHIRLQGPPDRSAIIDSLVIGASQNHWSELRNLTMNASVTVAIVARNARLVNNDINTSGGVVLQSASDSLVRNNTISAASGTNGIRILGSDNVEISNNTVLNYTNGINNVSGTNITIENNILLNVYDLAGIPSTEVRFNIISDGQFAGTNGNINLVPQFANISTDDLRLAPDSAGIAMGNPESDYRLEPQPNGYRINIGAYGNTSEATTISDIDNDTLPDSWELAFGLSTVSDSRWGDGDLDLVSNYHEYHAGTAPDDDTSVPLLDGADTDADGLDNSIDNCPFYFNPSQEDESGDGTGDACRTDFNVPLLSPLLAAIFILLPAILANFYFRKKQSATSS